MGKFTVIYDDGTEFSGDPFKHEWSKIDDTKKIIKLEYTVGNYCVVMEGYKQYNHTIEYIALDKKRISKIILMGRTDGDTGIIVLDIIKNRIGQCKRRCYEEYGKQVLHGWQEGELSTPKSILQKIVRDKKIK